MRSIANNPEIMSALIAAVVSLVIAACSGLYVLVRSNQRIDSLRNELLDTRRTERFLNAADGFREKFREYESTANEIKVAATGDDTELIQYLLNFYGGIARHIYDEHKSFLGDEELDNLQCEISKALASGKLDIPAGAERNRFLQSLCENIVRFCRAVYENSLKY